MSEVRTVSSYGHENYPKAGRVRPSQKVAPNTAVSKGASSGSSATLDTFNRGYHDPEVDRMNQLRRQAAVRPGAHRSGQIVVDPGYPLATAKPGHGASQANGRSGDALSQAPEGAARGSNGGGARQTAREVARAQTPKARPRTQSPRPAPSQAGRTAFEVNLGYPQAKSSESVCLQKKFSKELALIEEAKLRQQRATAKGSAANAKPSAAPKAQPQPKAKPQPKIKPQPPVKKTFSSQRARAAAGGLVSVVSGGVNLKNGVKNLANGNTSQGAMQVAQGGVSLADGANDLNNLRRGVDAAAAGKMTSRIKGVGGALNVGMAAYDTKQAYHEFKKGNSVAGSERASSAVINAVSAFPPTAAIGAVGGLADWAMQASGADDAMVRALTRGQDRAYAKQLQRDMRLAKTLAHTPTSTLARCTREQKQAYIRGLEGLKEYRRHYASQGNSGAVQNIDAHIARIKGAWSR